MKDLEGCGWLMHLTARVSGVDAPNAAGCIGFATSPDLLSWTLHPPVFAYGGTSHCLFYMDPAHQSERLTASHGNLGRGNHDLVAESPRGPCRLPNGPALDTEAERSAARMLKMDGRLNRRPSQVSGG